MFKTYSLCFYILVCIRTSWMGTYGMSLWRRNGDWGDECYLGPIEQDTYTMRVEFSSVRWQGWSWGIKFVLMLLIMCDSERESDILKPRLLFYMFPDWFKNVHLRSFSPPFWLNITWCSSSFFLLPFPRVALDERRWQLSLVSVKPTFTHSLKRRLFWCPLTSVPYSSSAKSALFVTFVLLC